jgi:D-beta-D-heptose 7-phosphate kinase / D-beta-D-heptose 1-phosphate adenosyltransferase
MGDDRQTKASAFAAGASRAASEKMVDREKLIALVDERRARGETIVLTNGCFDIVHIGHLRYLEQARAEGDVLVVCVNSDRSVRALKGPSRPVIPERERAEVLAHLWSVDYVCVFDEDTCEPMIELVRPHIYVKGAGQSVATIAEAPLVEQLGARIVIMPMVQNRSTTAIVERVIATHGGGG